MTRLLTVCKWIFMLLQLIMWVFVAGRALDTERGCGTLLLFTALRNKGRI